MRSSHIAKRKMSEKILYEFLNRIKAVSHNFRLHPAPIGFQDNKRVGYVYFYSDLPFGDIWRTAQYFAEEKRYEFIVQRNQLEDVSSVASAKEGQKKPLPYKLGKGGTINFLTEKTSLKEIFK